MSVVKEGWIQKQGKEWLSAWRKRYFRLKGDQLSYYLDPTSQKPQGVIDMNLVEDIKPKTSLFGGGYFHIITEERTYSLFVDSYADAQDWIEKLKIAKNNDLLKGKENFDKFISNSLN